MGPMLGLHTVRCAEMGTKTRSGGGARAPSASTAPCAHKDTVTKKLMDALAHLERDEGTINFVEKDAGVKLGMIPPDKVSVPTLLKSSTSDPSSVP